MGLAQIGEFSFIIASLGITFNLTSHFPRGRFCLSPWF